MNSVSINNVRYAIQKIGALVSQINAISDPDFSNTGAGKALARILELSKEKKGKLENLPHDYDEELISKLCRDIIIYVDKRLPLLGLILRSTNVRNSFEIYDPLLRMVRALVGSEVDLIISSEWRFSPHIYPLAFPKLEQFVFIGLPTTESENGLILPLAGHELGHSIWRRKVPQDVLTDKLNIEIIKMITSSWSEFTTNFGSYDKEKFASGNAGKEISSLVISYAARQCEEIFCDYVGVRLFGVSYIHAFRYLLAPSDSGARAFTYPSLKRRSQYIGEALRKFSEEATRKNIHNNNSGDQGSRGDEEFDKVFRTYYDEERYSRILEDFMNSFEEDDPITDGRNRYIIGLVDKVTDRFHESLRRFSSIYCDAIDYPSIIAAKSVAQRFKIGIPAEDVGGVAEVINAAWLIYEDIVSKDEGLAHQEERLTSLNELVFKTLEILEYELRMKGGS